MLQCPRVSFRTIKSIVSLSLIALLFFSALNLPLVSAQRSDFDVVILNGRVIDPESGLDATRNIGIRGNKIAAISSDALRGRTVIQAGGLVVAPGFIDLHSHGQTDENYRYKAMDGVTTALEMEVGVSPVAKWYADREGKSLINFGATVGHIPAKMAVMRDTGEFLPRDNAMNRLSTPEENKQVAQLIQRGIDEGALGIGFGINYVPYSTRQEILDLFRLAAERKVAGYVHLRFAGAVEPGSAIEALQEVLADTAATGASLHVVHITSTCLGQTANCLQMIEGARQRGLDVTTEAYPYTATMTDLASAIYNEGWQQRLGMTYKDLQWVATGERLTEETFAKYRKQGGSVIGHSIPEAISRLAAGNPLVMIASDGLLTNGKGHPRATGSYARVLGRYVREQKILSLTDAIKKMSLLPAQRLEAAAPMMRHKGRIKVGADADIVVFDAGRVVDRSTFENPAQFSEGMKYVLVNGVAVVQDGKLVEEKKPGVAIRCPIKK